MTTMDLTEDQLEKLVAPQAAPRTYELVYSRVLVYSYAQLASLYALYLIVTSAMMSTILFNWFLLLVAVVGVTVGGHRLWSHRSFKAKMPLQILLIVMKSVGAQYTAFKWVRDHRLHHRHSDTDADPHNAARGFFFSHIGWFLVKKHPEVIRRGKFIDMSDIYANPVVMLQKKYAIPFIGSICFLFPTIIPIYFWGESFTNAWHLVMLRWTMGVHIASTVNSLAHLVGTRPYDKNIQPANNFFACFLTLGEGFHNNHHVYPWDYRTAELGNNCFNVLTKFIDFFAWVGWAYDLKTVPVGVAKSRTVRTGDGSNEYGWVNTVKANIASLSIPRGKLYTAVRRAEIVEG